MTQRLDDASPFDCVSAPACAKVLENPMLTPPACPRVDDAAPFPTLPSCIRELENPSLPAPACPRVDDSAPFLASGGGGIGDERVIENLVVPAPPAAPEGTPNPDPATTTWELVYSSVLSLGARIRDGLIYTDATGNRHIVWWILEDEWSGVCLLHSLDGVAWTKSSRVVENPISDGLNPQSVDLLAKQNSGVAVVSPTATVGQLAIYDTLDLVNFSKRYGAGITLKQSATHNPALAVIQPPIWNPSAEAWVAQTDFLLKGQIFQDQGGPVPPFGFVDRSGSLANSISIYGMVGAWTELYVALSNAGADKLIYYNRDPAGGQGTWVTVISNKTFGRLEWWPKGGADKTGRLIMRKVWDGVEPGGVSGVTDPTWMYDRVNTPSLIWSGQHIGRLNSAWWEGCGDDLYFTTADQISVSATIRVYRATAAESAPTLIGAVPGGAIYTQQFNPIVWHYPTRRFYVAVYKNSGTLQQIYRSSAIPVV